MNAQVFKFPNLGFEEQEKEMERRTLKLFTFGLSHPKPEKRHPKVAFQKFPRERTKGACWRVKRREEVYATHT